MSSNREGPRVGRLRASDAANSQQSSAPATVPPIPLSDDQLDLVSPASQSSLSLSHSRNLLTPTWQQYVADTPASPSRTPSRGSTDLKMRDVTLSVSGLSYPTFLSLTLEPATVEEDFEAATLALDFVTSLLQMCNRFPDWFPLQDQSTIQESLWEFIVTLDLPAWQRICCPSWASVSKDEDVTICIPVAL
ncbi:hypothetical protein FA15DRAFT_711717 [Coprinopsis marcescibilis]|uniref:Uncharacterized protein n=1 Tax=Coprinopsis marcescibilis TaxID=230819 RepID=A0A5C3K9B3_COPMA|nr:hypothetical protein FA15DRAFT_711717 [Coprinopsis marcescibilis]